jgi:hypothetical protein
MTSETQKISVEEKDADDDEALLKLVEQIVSHSTLTKNISF